MNVCCTFIHHIIFHSLHQFSQPNVIYIRIKKLPSKMSHTDTLGIIWIMNVRAVRVNTSLSYRNANQSGAICRAAMWRSGSQSPHVCAGHLRLHQTASGSISFPDHHFGPLGYQDSDKGIYSTLTPLWCCLSSVSWSFYCSVMRSMSVH